MSIHILLQTFPLCRDGFMRRKLLILTFPILQKLAHGLQQYSFKIYLALLISTLILIFSPGNILANLCVNNI